MFPTPQPGLTSKDSTTTLQPGNRETLETIEQTCQRILATLESSKAQRTTPPPASENSNASELNIRKRNWLDKWLRLETANHPQLLELENVVYQFCSDYSKCPKRGYRLVIFGENGSGKTHAARAIWRWAHRIAMHIPLVNTDDRPGFENTGFGLATAEFHSWATLINRMKGGEWEFLEELFPVHLLALDDVGAEHDPSKIGAEKLYLLLERREFKWTIITTNIGQEEWENKMDRRISSRFFRNSKHVDLSQVPDYNSI